MLKEDKLAKQLTGQIDVRSLDLLLLTGVGAAYPMVRLHTLLNGLHAHMQDTPLVVFYPGKYDGASLRLFGLSPDNSDASQCPLLPRIPVTEIKPTFDRQKHPHP